MTKLKIPDDVPTVKDPHHAGINEWCWYGGVLWHRMIGHNKWIQSKKVHATPKRIMALAELYRLHYQTEGTETRPLHD